jgi:membrane peptidoglycan carboxypeptidase
MKYTAVSDTDTNRYHLFRVDKIEEPTSNDTFDKLYKGYTDRFKMYLYIFKDTNGNTDYAIHLFNLQGPEDNKQIKSINFTEPNELDVYEYVSNPTVSITGGRKLRKSKKTRKARKNRKARKSRKHTKRV